MGEAQDAFIIFDEAYEGADVDAFYLGKFRSFTKKSPATSHLKKLYSYVHNF